MTGAVARHPSVDKFARHVNPAFVKLLGVLGYGRVFTRAQDVWLWDDQDRRYLDCLAGFGAVNIGHNHPRLLARLKAFLDEQALNLNHLGPAAPAAELAEKLAALLPEPLEIALFSSSGAEGVEAAMKLAQAATGRRGFVSCRGGFHGTNLGALSVMGEPRLRRPFEPLLPDCEAVAFGDLAALERALARKPAAFVVEPIQAEAGVLLPPEGYLRRAQALCRERGALLILDEVQTGLGRTGRMFAFESEDFVPDVLVLAKSLGGSIAPIAATVVSRELHEKAYGSMDRFDLHSSTFAGNAFAATAALETLNILGDDGLAARAETRGAELLEALKQGLAGHPLVRSVRGRGLLVGIELGPTENGLINNAAPGLVEAVSEKVFGQWAALKLLEKGIVCQPASHHWNVLRLEPPLTIDAAETARAARLVVETLNEYQGLPALLTDVSLRLGRQCLNGGAFA